MQRAYSILAPGNRTLILKPCAVRTSDLIGPGPNCCAGALLPGLKRLPVPNPKLDGNLSPAGAREHPTAEPFGIFISLGLS